MPVCCRVNPARPSRGRAGIATSAEPRPAPGTYALVLSSSKDSLIKVGRLGWLRLQRGFYVYIGSALGPGGLYARIGHHRRRATRPRWHIDYLRQHTRLERVWYRYGGARYEHEWARAMRTLPGATTPLDGFGSSDCDCGSHLFFFENRPSLRALERLISAGAVRRARKYGRPAECSEEIRQVLPNEFAQGLK